MVRVFVTVTVFVLFGLNYNSFIH